MRKWLWPLVQVVLDKIAWWRRAKAEESPVADDLQRGLRLLRKLNADPQYEVIVAHPDVVDELVAACADRGAENWWSRVDVYQSPFVPPGTACKVRWWELSAYVGASRIPVWRGSGLRR